MAKRRRAQPVNSRTKKASRARRTPTPAALATPRSSPASHEAVVTIRTVVDGQTLEADVSRRAPIERLAEEWTYVLRSRARWADDDDVRISFRERAAKALVRLGVKAAFVRQLASARHVEVELHAWDPRDAEANRIHEAAADLPWEYLISAGSRGEGRYHSILITRLFRNNGPAIIAPPPTRVLFIESAPGRLYDAYDFASERVRIAAAIGAGDATSHRTMEIAATQRVDELIATVRRKAWDVLHVSGIDTHQAGWVIGDLYEELRHKPIADAFADAAGDIRDGMILRESHVSELPVPFDTLASVLINSEAPPSLVTLNLYYSGARIARELVRRGANAAIGYLDEIDDELAERFFQAFYWAWCRPDDAVTAIPEAFVEAWEKMSGSSRNLHGTSIVIWMGRSVFDQFERQVTAPPATQPARKAGDETVAALGTRPARDLLQVQLEVPDEINYSLLHNDRPLLETFTLVKLVKEPLDDISVQVELNLGGENYPYRCTTHMAADEPQLDVAPMVSIPLTAAFPRSLRERVQSTVYVKVCCEGRTAWETTSRVTLIPVDEWIDDTRNNPWLPSFVLPRDPAILRIVNSARRYLIGIRDDPAAGFDGYQSVDEDADEPTAGIDAQVRAIWTAIVNDYRLQYINPPPSYSRQSQRLRTPSDILASNSGTCIDLALLLASCLEYLDIYPVVVLLEGHAFVGYWRSDTAHDAFVQVDRIPAEVPGPGSAVARSTGMRLVDQYGWRLTRLNYDEIMGYVTAGDLVMLEATYLTSASSFAEATEEGRANMRSRKEFDSLLDILLARSAAPAVTPLPIISD